MRVQPRADGARNYTQCDSLLIGDRCGAHTVPYIEVRNPSARIEHEATTSKISDDQLFYCRQRGHQRRGCAVADRQRVLQGSAEGTADGVRGRGAKAPRREFGRQRGMMRFAPFNRHHGEGRDPLRSEARSLPGGDGASGEVGPGLRRDDEEFSANA